MVLVALLVEAGVRAFDYEQSIATPSSTLRALYDELAAGTLTGEIGVTLSAYFQGLAIAIVIGVGAGVLIGSSRTLLDASSVVIEFLRPIPAVALIPLAIVFFGTFGIGAHRFVVAYAAVWPILINTIYGVRGADRMLRRRGENVRGRPRRPALPRDAARRASEHRDRYPGQRSHRASLVCVTAEFRTGRGRHRRVHGGPAVRRTGYPELYAAVVLVSLFGFAVNAGLRAVQRRTLFWAGEERATQ